ncbi:histone-lysine N-methyltransferase SETMAR-like [Glossina fuscipes]|uniref:Histone-lysine N-methyltransferase SETMAR-like n=1 Tax=Glossina fuscipes TaxID=7396 RepID=A0A8U0WJ70_9MUSC|nr:histone-lysine N-methyltransferase SETMAR-like [Glossina fuscipes]
MKCNKENFRLTLLYYFRKGKSAVQRAKKLPDVYGNEFLKERQCRNWFEIFRSEDFSLKDDLRSGRPVELNDVAIKTITEAVRHITARDFADKLNVSHIAIERH